MNSEFEIRSDGSATIKTTEAIFRDSKLQEILEKISDPSIPTSVSSRLIATEITLILKEMVEELDMQKIKMLNSQLRGLKILQESLLEAEKLSKNDSLNFDGPKFQFVFKEITSYFKQALKESGIEDSIVNNVLKHYSDIIKMNDDKLRKDTDRLGTGKR